MAGGPSHIDTWDPKPDRPLENRGPFGVTPTKLPGVVHLRAPAEAGGDARQVHDHPLGRCPPQQSRAEQGLPDRQPGGRAADQPRRRHVPGHRLDRRQASRREPSGDAALRGVHEVAHRTSPSPATWASSTTRSSPTRRRSCRSTPTSASTPARRRGAELFRFAAGLSHERLHDRRALLADFDRLRSDLDQAGSMAALDRYRQQAVEMLVGRRAQRGVRPVAASRTRSATATASTSGASRRCWPGGWSRRAWRS